MFIFIVFSTLLVLYLAANLYLFFFQRSLIYKPVKEIKSPFYYGLNKMQVIDLQTSDDIKLESWLYKTDSEKVILYLHGNAGNLSDRVNKFAKLSDLGASLFAVSWRGFGNSGGSPTETGLYDDARAAIAYLKKLGFDESSIIIYGESLGTGVATKMAMEFNIDRLILESPYTSITNRAAELYPYIPVKWLLKDTFASIDRVQNIEVPILFFHGERDETMPVHHSKKLYEKANQPKKIVIFKEVGHTDFDLDEIYELVSEFVK